MKSHCQIKVKSFQLCVIIMSYANFCLGIILQKVDLNRRGYGLLLLFILLSYFFSEKNFSMEILHCEAEKDDSQRAFGPKKKGQRHQVIHFLFDVMAAVLFEKRI